MSPKKCLLSSDSKQWESKKKVTLSFILATACSNISECALKKSCFFLTNFSLLSLFLLLKSQHAMFFVFLSFFFSQTIKSMFKREMFERCSTFLRQELWTTTKMDFSFKNARGANAYSGQIKSCGNITKFKFSIYKMWYLVKIEFRSPELIFRVFFSCWR